MDKMEKEKYLDNLCFVKMKMIEMVCEHCEDMRKGLKHEDDDFDYDDTKHLEYLAGIADDVIAIHKELHAHDATEGKEYPHKKANPYGGHTR